MKKTILIDEIDESRATEERDSNRHIKGFNEDGAVKTSLVDSWQSHKNGDKMSLKVYKDFTITSIEVTLTLSK